MHAEEDGAAGACGRTDGKVLGVGLAHGYLLVSVITNLIPVVSELVRPVTQTISPDLQDAGMANIAIS